MISTGILVAAIDKQIDTVTAYILLIRQNSELVHAMLDQDTLILLENQILTLQSLKLLLLERWGE